MDYRSEAIKQQTKTMYSCMATGQILWITGLGCGLSCMPALSQAVCDNSTAEVAYAAIVAIYKWTLPPFSCDLLLPHN